MSGTIRWVALFAVVVLAGAGIYALWGGVTEALLKTLASFSIVAIALVAVVALGRTRPAARDDSRPSGSA